MLNHEIEKLKNFIVFQELRTKFETLNPQESELYAILYNSDKFDIKGALNFIEKLQEKEEENEFRK